MELPLMRWFVEIAPLGTSSAPLAKLCLEAPKWSPALLKAREIHGEKEPLSRFSIEVLEDGYAAIDGASRLTYLVREAPADAPLTNGAEPKAPPARPSSRKLLLVPEQPGDSLPPPAAYVETPAPPPASAAPAPVEVAPPPPASAPPSIEEAPPPPASAPSHLPPFRLLSERAEDAGDAALMYRELAYAVAPSTDEEQAEALLLDRFASVRASLGDSTRHKFVNLAVFDHVFQTRPKRAPIAVLAWKDWKSPDPKVTFPRRDGAPSRPSAVSLTPTPPPVRAVSVESVSFDAPPAPAAPPPAPPPPPEEPEVAAMPVVAVLKAPVVVAEAPAPAEEIVVEVESPVPAPAEEILVDIEAPAAAAPEEPVARAEEAAAVEVPVVVDEEPVVVVDEEGEAIADEVVVVVEAPAEAALPPPPAPPPPPDEAEPIALIPKPNDALPLPPSRTAKTPAAASPTFEAPASSRRPPQAEEAAPASTRSRRVWSDRPAPPGRVAGEELLTAFFEESSDLHFLQDSLEGAQFTLKLALDKLPSEIGLIHLFDINKREFVVVRQHGGTKDALLARTAERAPIARAAMRTKLAIVVPDASADDRVDMERWAAFGVTPRSVLCAPVELAGRYLGLIELANPLDQTPYSDSDGHAFTYLGQQLAELVASRGVITDAEQITERRGMRK